MYVYLKISLKLIEKVTKAWQFEANFKTIKLLCRALKKIKANRVKLNTTPKKSLTRIFHRGSLDSAESVPNHKWFFIKIFGNWFESHLSNLWPPFIPRGIRFSKECVTLLKWIKKIISLRKRLKPTGSKVKSFMQFVFAISPHLRVKFPKISP